MNLMRIINRLFGKKVKTAKLAGTRITMIALLIAFGIVDKTFAQEIEGSYYFWGRPPEIPTTHVIPNYSSDPKKIDKRDLLEQRREWNRKREEQRMAIRKALKDLSSEEVIAEMPLSSVEPFSSDKYPNKYKRYTSFFGEGGSPKFNGMIPTGKTEPTKFSIEALRRAVSIFALTKDKMKEGSIEDLKFLSVEGSKAMYGAPLKVVIPPIGLSLTTMKLNSLLREANGIEKNAYHLQNTLGNLFFMKNKLIELTDRINKNKASNSFYITAVVVPKQEEELSKLEEEYLILDKKKVSQQERLFKKQKNFDKEMKIIKIEWVK